MGRLLGYDASRGGGGISQGRRSYVGRHIAGASGSDRGTQPISTFAAAAPL